MARPLQLVSLSLLTLGACAEPRVQPMEPAPVEQASTAPTTDAPASKVALLVGIDRYPADAGLGELRGCGRDTERMRVLLVERFGFPAEDVTVLRDAEATHAAIVRAFHAQLIERARPGTEAVFYFAGHGSRVPDADTGPDREPDGLDTTFLAYDSRSEGRTGEHDFVDDELRSLVAAASSRGAFVTVLTDSCHSGGALRGVSNFRPRAAPQGRRPFDRAYGQGFWPAGVPYYDDSNRVVIGSSVQIAASSRDQVAGEIDLQTAVGTFEPSGAMTWYLAQGLERAQPGATWGGVAQQAALGVSTLLPYQDMAWYGDTDRTIFGASFEGVTGWRATLLEPGLVQVEAGYLHGVREGSELDIRSSDGRNSYGRAIVEWTSEVQSRARFTRLPTADLSRTALRAVEVGRPAGEPQLSLWCDVPGLAPWFAGSQWVGIASSLETADLVLRSGVGGYQLWTPEGLPLPGWLPILPPTFADQGRWLGVCEPYLRRESLWRSTSRLALESGSLQLDVRLETPRLDELRGAVPAGWNRWVPAAIDGRRLVGGVRGDLPMGVFRVRNPGRSAVRLSVVNLPEDARARRVVEPVAGREARTLAPGETCSVRVGFPAPDPWPLDRAMCDRYLFLATIQPFDTWTIASEVELRGDSESAPLPGVLRQAQARYATRGAGAVDLDRSGFGVAAIDVFVSRPR
ncbi:MAG: caspase family protein [Planctomycetota bacterium]|nr:caspase family protein [Planctomycetota bacterium]